MARGGSILGALEFGTAVYAAKSSKTFPSFLFNFAKYFAMLLVGLFVLGFVLYVLGFRTEYFTPIAPSREGDEKAVTPAGNVILY